jgi:phospholipase C
LPFARWFARLRDMVKATIQTCMNTRRDFFKKAAFLSAGAGLTNLLLPAIERAAAIDPHTGSTYQDAEHIVILMQENRSFDHCFGTLRGVRGFNDPRAVTLPDQNPVWLQTNASGETYAPFRLDIKDTKATWMGSLPHSWTDQNDAKNHGNHDKWLIAKPSGRKEYASMPLTMGHYTREDLPFYYALADAFTVCDQHFCSSLTGTTPNRLYLWSGTIREAQTPDSHANVRNSDVDYGSWAHWTTFPERLEAASISWKIYQNEVSIESGLDNEADSWLTNFTDNPIEWFSQYHIGLSKTHRAYVEKAIPLLPSEIEELQKQVNAAADDPEKHAELSKLLHKKQKFLQRAIEERNSWASEDQLPQRERNLHDKAFTTNLHDRFYRELTTLRYQDGNIAREIRVPKGDVLYQFRKDVHDGNLPTVSWLVAPENYSDHPGAPWFGAWYVAEVMDILTHNPEVWKKTIFILTYDENDGYFDHIPPFGVPHPGKPETGAMSPGIDGAMEYVTLEQDLAGNPGHGAREGCIGLGFRVPMVIASPWSRGGFVCSQVFDHTSVLQFLEHFLTTKTGKEIQESNITQWRRTVCGNLTTTFRSESQGAVAVLPYPGKDEMIEDIHKAKFKGLPGYRQLSAQEIAQFKQDRWATSFNPQQETGVRPSCPLLYELYAEGRIDKQAGVFDLTLEARNAAFGARSAGSPFYAYVPGKNEESRTRTYTVRAGHALKDSWRLNKFENDVYHLRVSGPNGFFREFAGTAVDPDVEIHCEYARHPSKNGSLSGDVEIRLANLDSRKTYTVLIEDVSYNGGKKSVTIHAGKRASIALPHKRSFGWYDFTVKVDGAETSSFLRRYAGHVETGNASFSDPLMGRVRLDSQRS